jgi:hypothetical protein
MNSKGAGNNRGTKQRTKGWTASRDNTKRQHQGDTKDNIKNHCRGMRDIKNVKNHGMLEKERDAGKRKGCWKKKGMLKKNQGVLGKNQGMPVISLA